MADEATNKAEEESPDGALGVANSQADRFRKGVETIRTRSDRVSNAIFAVGSATVSALGIAKFADVFPYSGGLWWVGVAAGLMAAAVGVFWLYGIFNRPQEPLVMVSDAHGVTDDEGNPLKRSELDAVHQIYDDMAVLNDAPSLLAYEARGRRLRHLAEDREPTEAAALNAKADLIAAEVQATLARAQHAVIRRRANKAGATLSSFSALLLLFGGLGLATVANDAIQNLRSDQEKATASGDAREATKERNALIKKCVVHRKMNTGKALDAENVACVKLELSGGAPAEGDSP